MSYEKGRIRDVNNQYGARKTGYSAGKIKTEGVTNELTLDVTGEVLNNLDGLPEVILPAGAIFVDAYAEVIEAFDLGGTTPEIQFGTKGSAGTNGGAVSEAEAEAIGTYDITASLGGTWAVGSDLAADTTVAVALGGVTPTADAKLGYVRITVTYKKLAGR